MKEVSLHISSAAEMILCTLTGCTCKCTIAEYSADAGSYRGDILGAILAQLILCTAVQGQMGPYPIITEDCDYKGFIRHGNKPHRPLSMNQTHTNVLQLLKEYIAKQPFILKLLYVVSHTDDIKSLRECSIKEKKNIKVDHLAKKALKCAHATGTFFDD
jgi:hypothetical protein